MTTEQVVAEYEPVTNNPLHHASCRKSEMVRDWCEKTSLVMNNLYPTILRENLIEDESAPWNSNDFTKNITLDLTKDRCSNETKTSYRTCLSKPVDIEISGIRRLEDSVNENSSSYPCQDNSKRNRTSVYEDFSLPGSPNSITHINYKTKTSLRKCKKDTLSAEFEKMTLDNSQSLTDNTQLDKALIVIQNKTNEWLFNSHNDTDVKAMNTRRSSASSGVSSNFSGGSIVIANVQEEYKYEDEEEDVVLIEKRLLVSPVV